MVGRHHKLDRAQKRESRSKITYVLFAEMQYSVMIKALFLTAVYVVAEVQRFLPAAFPLSYT